MFMTAAGFIILILLGLLGLWLFVEIGGFPGKKAKERNHPQAEAITVLGWLGLLFGGVGWAVAVVWAYTKPVFVPVPQGAATGGDPPVAESTESEEAS
jgi:cytochrome c biogenesis protein CcdA